MAGGNENLNGAVQGGARRVVDAEGKEGGKEGVAKYRSQSMTADNEI